MNFFFFLAQSEYQYELLERMLEEENGEKSRYFNDENENEVRQLKDLVPQSAKDEDSDVNVEDVRDFVNLLAESLRDQEIDEKVVRQFQNDKENNLRV